jgi:hypothetical protein
MIKRSVGRVLELRDPRAQSLYDYLMQRVEEGSDCLARHHTTDLSGITPRLTVLEHHVKEMLVDWMESDRVHIQWVLENFRDTSQIVVLAKMALYRQTERIATERCV